ncbi:N-glycosidase YbiA-like [Oppia nitens]|uniref:N-glycosidase YbiA-like n=1 Tax=Oppia nitens TaxID=1686743 RepID=UPI0023D9BEE4|nr:N-glycosidase YbiA-like [Oppia nitens]
MTRVECKSNNVFVYSTDNQLIGYGGISRTSPLSNFYKTSFMYGGHQYTYAECAIMYEKAVTFNDTKTAELILKCTQPAAAKRLGRRIKPFDPKTWIEVRNEKVPKILYEKFTQNAELKEWLISTGSAVLAEISTENKDGSMRYSDKVWGIGIGPSHKDIDKPMQWHKYGNNFLGKTLMKVRQMIVDDVTD